MPSPTPSTPDLEPDDSPLDGRPAGAAGVSALPGEAGPAATDDAQSVDESGHDAAWFEAVVRDHASAVHRFVVRRAGRDEAEDLTADVLATAWRRRADVPDGAELPWLYRTAGFVVANHRRKGRPVPIGDVPDEIDDDDPAVRAVQDERVREVLGALGARDRQILLLNAWEGLTGDALADVLGIGRGGADAALSRARARLREAWAVAGA
ncbi:RNA polymerase sigma factor [Cellulomonas sp. P5_C6]